MTAGPPRDGLDTFPRLVLRHAAERGRKSAMRHKDLGLWQSWSWSEIAANMRAYAAGLALLGVERGEAVAIIGAIGQGYTGPFSPRRRSARFPFRSMPMRLPMSWVTCSTMPVA